MISTDTSRKLKTQKDLISINTNRSSPKYIKCPECQGLCLIDFKDYRINLIDCGNPEHINNNISLEDYLEKTQTRQRPKNCDICNQDKNGEFYFCNSCNKKFCNGCQRNHEENNRGHDIIEYELINFACLSHNKEFTLYCERCKINICEECESQHPQDGHTLIRLNTMSRPLNIDEIKDKKEKFKRDINEIIEILKVIINNIEIYYKIN